MHSKIEENHRYLIILLLYIKSHWLGCFLDFVHNFICRALWSKTGFLLYFILQCRDT